MAFVWPMDYREGLDFSTQCSNMKDQVQDLYEEFTGGHGYYVTMEDRVHTSDRPWITKKLKTLIRKQQLTFHRHGRDSNCYKLLREKVQKEIRSAKQNFYEHKVSDLEQSNIKNWWKHIRRLNCSRQSARLVPLIYR